MALRAVLVTGFEPYGGGHINPSLEVARNLDGAAVASVPVVGLALAVDFPPLQRRTLEQHQRADYASMSLPTQLEAVHIILAVSLAAYQGEDDARAAAALQRSP